MTQIIIADANLLDAELLSYALHARDYRHITIASCFDTLLTAMDAATSMTTLVVHEDILGGADWDGIELLREIAPTSQILVLGDKVCAERIEKAISNLVYYAPKTLSAAAMIGHIEMIDRTRIANSVFTPLASVAAIA